MDRIEENKKGDTLQQRIKILRTHLGLSQLAFAAAIDRTKSFISNVENGHAGLSKGTVRHIHDVFGANEEWLSDGIGDMFDVSHETSKENSNGETVDLNNIGVRVKEARKKAGLKQVELADKIGYHKNQISNVESGKYIPSDRFLRAVSRICEVNYVWLKTGTEGEDMDLYDIFEWLKTQPEIVAELRKRMEE